VIRLRVFLGTVFTLAAILGAFVRAQSTDPEKKKNARGDFADALRNARADGETETGETEVENEKESDADANPQTEAKENSSGRRRSLANPETKSVEIAEQEVWR